MRRMIALLQHDVAVLGEVMPSFRKNEDIGFDHGLTNVQINTIRLSSRMGKHLAQGRQELLPAFGLDGKT